MAELIPITVANGDGIGPEIMNATLRILEAAGAPLEIETIEIGEKVYLAGNTSGIEPSSWDSLRRTKVFLKAPIPRHRVAASRVLMSPCARLSDFLQTSVPAFRTIRL